MTRRYSKHLDHTSDATMIYNDRLFDIYAARWGRAPDPAMRDLMFGRAQLIAARWQQMRKAAGLRGRGEVPLYSKTAQRIRHAAKATK